MSHQLRHRLRHQDSTRSSTRDLMHVTTVTSVTSIFVDLIGSGGYGDGRFEYSQCRVTSDIGGDSGDGEGRDRPERLNAGSFPATIRPIARHDTHGEPLPRLRPGRIADLATAESYPSLTGSRAETVGCASRRSDPFSLVISRFSASGRHCAAERSVSSAVSPLFTMRTAAQCGGAS